MAIKQGDIIRGHEIISSFIERVTNRVESIIVWSRENPYIPNDEFTVSQYNSKILDKPASNALNGGNLISNLITAINLFNLFVDYGKKYTMVRFMSLKRHSNGALIFQTDAYTHFSGVPIYETTVTETPLNIDINNFFKRGDVIEAVGINRLIDAVANEVKRINDSVVTINKSTCHCHCHCHNRHKVW